MEIDEMDIEVEREFAMKFIRTLFNEGLSDRGYKALDNLECQMSVLLSELEKYQHERFVEKFLIEKLG